MCYCKKDISICPNVLYDKYLSLFLKIEGPDEERNFWLVRKAQGT